MPIDSLLAAIIAGDRDEVARQLTAEPGLIHAKTSDGSSLIQVACYAGNFPLGYYLVARGATLDVWSACTLGDDETVNSFVNEFPRSVNMLSPDGLLPLCLAGAMGHLRVLRTLCGASADPNLASTAWQGVRPLHATCLGGHIECADLLLHRGADVDGIQSGGFTPLFAAIRNGSAELVRLLLRHGASRIAMNEAGEYPLDFAMRLGRMDLVTELQRAA